MKLFSASVFVLCAGCSSSSSPTSTSNDGGIVSVPTNTSIAIDGDPNGLFWDATSSTLYIADDGNDRILQYTDAASISKVADLPGTDTGIGLGQLVRTSDGSIYVTRFGYGTEGDVAKVAPDGTASALTGLDVTKRRIGLAVDANGILYDTYFVKQGNGYVGAVAKLGLDGTETDIANNLQKPVGVLATSDTLYVDDQTLGEISKTPLASPGTLTTVASLPDADLLCAGPNGSIFSGGADGNVRQIDSSGNVTVFATGFTAARGVAYDAVNKRLFVANHVGATSSNTIEVRPVP
jgi:sugar lactone lactonase YvrE